MEFRAGALAALSLLAAVSCADTRLARLETALDARDSATATLAQWCERRHFADPPRIVARPVAGAVATEPADARRLLDIAPAAQLGFRHVELACGSRVLSVARNWYVPARLTPDMNDTLAHSQVPFGKVAAPLGYRREPLVSRRGAADGCPAGTVLTHRAMLRLPDGHPLALLVECYQRAAIE